MPLPCCVSCEPGASSELQPTAEPVFPSLSTRVQAPGAGPLSQSLAQEAGLSPEKYLQGSDKPETVPAPVTWGLARGMV